MKTIHTILQKAQSGRYAAMCSLTVLLLLLLAACEDTDYLDEDASERPPLSAKVKFINAVSETPPLNFWDFTRQVNSTPVKFGQATAYLDTQFGKVQFNATRQGSNTYVASYVFGGSANFVRERGTPSSGADYSGPNGPIATFNHTIIATNRRTVSKRNPGNVDSLILVYDDLTVPAAGKVKIRFANFSRSAGSVDFADADGNIVYSNVSFGTFGDQVKITYDATGKSPSTIEGLSWKTLAPYKEIDASASAAIQIFETVPSGRSAILTVENIALEAGKIYTVFISDDAQGNVKAITITH